MIAAAVASECGLTPTMATFLMRLLTGIVLVLVERAKSESRDTAFKDFCLMKNDLSMCLIP